MRDPRSGRYFAGVTHGQFGPHLFYADDPTGKWQQAEGPAFPSGANAAVERIWVVEPGVADGELWCGVAPAALFRSSDGGKSWSLVQGLWDVPERPQWEPGAGGLCLHSICPWPGDPQRLAVGISSAGVWLTEDAGKSWRRAVSGLVPRYLPEEARAGHAYALRAQHEARAAPACDALHAVPRRRVPLGRRRRELDRHRQRTAGFPPISAFRWPSTRTTPTARSSFRWSPTPIA